jgi:hypothetical protein
MDSSGPPQSPHPPSSDGQPILLGNPSDDRHDQRQHRVWPWLTFNLDAMDSFQRPRRLGLRTQVLEAAVATPRSTRP